MKKKIIVAVAGIGIIAIATFYYLKSKEKTPEETYQFATTPIDREVETKPQQIYYVYNLAFPEIPKPEVNLPQMPQFIGLSKPTTPTTQSTQTTQSKPTTSSVSKPFKPSEEKIVKPIAVMTPEGGVSTAFPEKYVGKAKEVIVETKPSQVSTAFTQTKTISMLEYLAYSNPFGR